MNLSEFLRCSFVATVAFALLALALLGAAGLVFGSKATLVLAVLASGASYIAQHLFGHAAMQGDDEANDLWAERGIWFQRLAVVLAVSALFFL